MKKVNGLKNKKIFNKIKKIKECPSCSTSDLDLIGVDLLCSRCGWNSIAAYVEAGGMDNLFSAWIDQFEPEVNHELNPKKQNIEKSKTNKAA